MNFPRSAAVEYSHALDVVAEQEVTMAIPRPSYSKAELIRMAYPRACPISESPTRNERAGEGADVKYCVGGAVYMFVHQISVDEAKRHERFPPVTNIAAALKKMNAELTWAVATTYALSITQSNDIPTLGGPDRAWGFVCQALDVQARHKAPFGRLTARVRACIDRSEATV